MIVLGEVDCWLVVMMIVFIVWGLFYECLGLGILLVGLIVVWCFGVVVAV